MRSSTTAYAFWNAAMFLVDADVPLAILSPRALRAIERRRGQSHRIGGRHGVRFGIPGFEYGKRIGTEGLCYVAHTATI